MDENLMPSARAGRLRRISGFVLLALGMLLAARVGWLGAFYGEGFGTVEWIRFFGLLVIGIWLSLAGCWLAYRSRIAAWTLFVSFAGLLAAGIVHDLWWR